MIGTANVLMLPSFLRVVTANVYGIFSIDSKMKPYSKWKQLSAGIGEGDFQPDSVLTVSLSMYSLQRFLVTLLSDFT